MRFFYENGKGIKYIFYIKNSFYKGAVALILPLQYNKNTWMA